MTDAITDYAAWVSRWFPRLTLSQRTIMVSKLIDERTAVATRCAAICEEERRKHIEVCRDFRRSGMLEMLPLAERARDTAGYLRDVIEAEFGLPETPGPTGEVGK